MKPKGCESCKLVNTIYCTDDCMRDQQIEEANGYIRLDDYLDRFGSGQSYGENSFEQ